MKRCPQCKQFYGDEVQHCPEDGALLAERLPGKDRFMGRILAGRYEVLDLLGRGGFGTVYKVRDRKLEDVIALKVFERGRFSDVEAHEAMKRFRREGVILRRTGKRSRHIVTVYDFEEDEAEDLFYFTMDFVDGTTLAEILASNGPLGTTRTLFLARQICSALEAAHQEGVVHRDLKLENIMVVREGDEEVVKVLDFGIAKVMGSGSLTNLAMGVPGTPGYAPPEQLKAPSAVDARTDLFSLGVVLYGLLSGREPWSSGVITEPTSSDNIWELIRSSMEEDPTPLRRWTPEVPRRLESAISRLLSKRQEDRFQSAGELDQELARIQEELAAVEGGAAVPRSSPGGGPSRFRRPLAILVPVAALIALAVLLQSRGADRTAPLSLDEIVAEAGRGTLDRLEIRHGRLEGVRQRADGTDERFHLVLFGTDLQATARALADSGADLGSPGRGAVRLVLGDGVVRPESSPVFLSLEGSGGGCSPCEWGEVAELQGGWYTVRAQGEALEPLILRDVDGVYSESVLAQGDRLFVPSGASLELVTSLPAVTSDDRSAAEGMKPPSNAEEASSLEGEGSRAPEVEPLLSRARGALAANEPVAARDLLAEALRLAPEHEGVLAFRASLFEEARSRSRQAAERSDPVEARRWALLCQELGPRDDDCRRVVAWLADRERARAALDTTPSGEASPAPNPPRAYDLVIRSFRFADREFTLEGSFKAVSPTGIEFCVATVFSEEGQGPLRDQDGEYALGGVVAVVDPPLHPPADPGEVSFAHVLPAQQLDLARGTVWAVASSRIWAGPCGLVDPASPPLAQALTQPLCVTRLAGGWYACRGG